MITSGEHETAFGFERWKFFLDLRGVQSAVEKGARMGDPEYIKEIPQRFWMERDRIPSRIEIAEMKLGRVDEKNRVEITVLIKRGHWIISDFFRKHEGVTAVTHHGDGAVYLTCKCCPEESIAVPLSSLPRREK